MEVWDDSKDEELSRLIEACAIICERLEIPTERRDLIVEKIVRGHQEHMEPISSIRTIGELVGEKCDDVGYCCVDLACGRWTEAHEEFLRLGQQQWDLIERMDVE